MISPVPARPATIGLGLHPRPRKIAAEWVEAFRSLPVANVSDCMARMAGGGPRLRPMRAGGPMVGPALTVRTRPGDNLMVHKAIDLAEPGDIIVVDAGGDLTNAIIGEIMLRHAASRGVAGFVIDGAIRDSDVLRRDPLPVYAAGVTHRGPYKDGPGEVNATVSVGGMIVAPGDLMIGDADGVLCVPFDHVEALHGLATAKRDAETGELAAIARGTLDRSWVNAALQRLGVPMPGT